MVTGVRSTRETTRESEASESPEISVCESGPGKTVFLESGNTDGWIASDLAVDVTR